MRHEQNDRGPALAADLIRVQVDVEEGTFDVIATREGAPALRGCASAMSASGREYTTRGVGLVDEGVAPVSDAHGNGLRLTLRRKAAEGEPELLVMIAVYEDQPFVTVWCEVANSAAGELSIREFRVLDGGRIRFTDGGMPSRFYKHGWQSWSPTLVVDCGGEDFEMAPPIIGTGVEPEMAAGRFTSDMMAVVGDAKGVSGLVAGFVSTADQFAQVWLDREEALVSAVSYADRVTVGPGCTLRSERLLVEPTAEPLGAMRRYGRALGAEMQGVRYENVASGWCSWYHYFRDVSESDIVANLEMLAEEQRALPIEYVQIDDGYQAGIGDWLTVTEKFPRGLGWLVEQIHGRGFKAGLWLAPFIMGEHSRLYAEHPEWAVQYRPGSPYIAHLNWEQRCYAIDLTRPDVHEWLMDVFTTVCEDWGFDYVKIDFVYAAAVEGIRHDRNVTRAQAYRRGLETIRSAVGERFILGCGNPMGPSVGVVDGARISPDVAPHWLPVRDPRDPDRSAMSPPSTLNAIRSTMARFWMHDALWMNDPDCLMVRDTDTDLTPDEVRTLATVIAMSGGMVLDSDDLTKVPQERLEMISMLLPTYGRAATPMDLFTSPGLPRILDLDCGGHHVTALFNWDDQAASVKLPMPWERGLVFDAWERRPLGSMDAETELMIPPHGCRLLGLRPVRDRPQVVGSTFHALQGAVELADEVWQDDTLILQVKPVARRAGEILISRPEGWQGAKAESDAGDLEESADAWSLALGVDRVMEVRVRFER